SGDHWSPHCGPSSSRRASGKSSNAPGAPGPTPAATFFFGQITPSHCLSRHLKSGALGFFLPSRLSHIFPPHVGQAGSFTGEGEGGGASAFFTGTSARVAL